MSYKKVLSVVGSEVVDQCDLKDGLAPAETIADSGVLDTGISDFSGHLVADVGEDSTIAACHVASDAQVISGLTGSAAFNAAKDNASTINIYVEGGTIQVQNLSGAAISLSARLF